MTDYDFSCYVLKYEVESIRGLRYKKDLFAPQDGQKVPLLWNYRHFDPASNLGHVVLENRSNGVYAYCYLSDTPSGKAALKVLDEVALGPYVTGYKAEYGYIVKGRIASCSLMLERMDDDEAYHPVLNKDKKESKMTTKELGKITFAEFGTSRDYPSLIGLQLGFHMGSSSVMDGGKHTVNISPEVKSRFYKKI